MPPRKLTTRLKVNEFYCVKCQKRRVGQKMKLGHFTYKNKSSARKKKRQVPVLKSVCSQCDTKLFKIVKKQAVPALKKRLQKQ